MRTVLPLRTSAALWLSPIAVYLMVSTGLSVNPGGGLPYWSDLETRASASLSLGLFFACGAAAWEAARFRGSYLGRREPTVRPALLVVWTQTFPIFIVVGVGWLVTLGILIAESGWPSGIPTLPVLATQLFMVIAVVAFGYFLGSITPAVFAVPTAIFAIFAWASFPGARAGDDHSWQNVSGFNLWLSSSSFDDQTAAGALWAPILVGVAALLALWLITRYRRTILSIVAALVLIVAGTLVGQVAAVGTSFPASAARSASQVQCSGSTPKICLWPEQQTTSGRSIRSVLDAAYRVAQTHSAHFPSVIQAGDLDFVPRPVSASTPLQLVNANPTRKQILSAYIEGLLAGPTCPSNSFTAQQEYDLVRTTYAIAMLIDVNPESTLPPGTAKQKAQFVSSIKISTPSNALKVYQEWTNQPKGCRS